ncbi:glycosyltransferase [Flavobacterium cerinum]|uniref:Glycosyltransferase n=1 Tax=Flavobacterium cerinum TaxID=2502784 RepID=A0ABY5IW29_9FLAO|nr:glycosyltransferase [Flavobacterium cerinum]UUC47048.1 glycosyltransferase [Flavobacterium cerinum]
MKLLVISSASFIRSDSGWQAYTPYVNEMEIWQRYSDEIQFCCPIWESDRGLFVRKVPFVMNEPVVLEEFNIKSVSAILRTVLILIPNSVRIFKAIRTADHIHLRCPGNVGLLACFVQILFPNKIKTAKYAGNWDPKSKQPWSYRLQKWILNNTRLTKNIKVLVYGEWEGASANIKPFFTATYTEKDKKETPLRIPEGTIKLLFVGTLSKGKQPLYAVKLAHKLLESGYNVRLDLYGEGAERENLTAYIQENKLQQNIELHGNQKAEMIEKAYQESHFLILPSQSEGWPKVVAEAMFWGCVPVATKVSCVPTMLANSERGILLTMSEKEDIKLLKQCIDHHHDYKKKAIQAMEWSQQFTLDYFENEIQKILTNH